MNMAFPKGSMFHYELCIMYKCGHDTLIAWLKKLDQKELKKRAYEVGKNRKIPPKALEYIFEQLGDPRP